MRITSRAGYGLRLLLEIALNQQGGPVTLSDISTRQGISHPYLWQVVNPLKTVGILVAKRGVNGGYVLGRDPSQISVRDVLDALEGDLDFVASQSQHDQGPNRIQAIALGTWMELEAQLSAILGRTTLKDILERYDALTAADALSFNI